MTTNAAQKSSSQGSPSEKRPTLDPLLSFVKEDLEKVNATLMKQMQSPVPLIPELAGHLIAAGGKRIRPMLTLLSAKFCAYKGEHHIDLAACVEFIHAATLLHDDVVDESDLRRGKATANTVWGNKESVLVGDFLFSRAFQLMVTPGSLPILRLLSEAAATIAEGEVMQLLISNHTKTLEAQYLEVITKKTAPLFKAAAQIGPLLTNRPEEEKALAIYGENLGIVFQLIDDILDYKAEANTLGKSLGDDFREGKMTLPVILAYEAGNEEEKAFWSRTFDHQEQNESDFHQALTYLKKHHALELSLDRAKTFANKAKSALAPFPDSKEKGLMLDVLNFSLDRAY